MSFFKGLPRFLLRKKEKFFKSRSHLALTVLSLILGGAFYIPLWAKPVNTLNPPSPKEKRVIEALVGHFSKYPTSTHTNAWSCLKLEHTLTQVFNQTTHTLQTTVLELSKEKKHKKITQNFYKALGFCFRRYNALGIYDSIARVLLVLNVAYGKKDTFLLNYLNKFHPQKPQDIRPHKVLLDDLESLPSAYKKKKAYIFASSLIQGILNPQKLFKVKKDFSSLFYRLLESQVWKIHFDFDRSLKILKSISKHWLTKRVRSKNLKKLLKPMEVRHFKNRQRYFLTSNRWLIKRLKFLSRWARFETSKKGVKAMIRPFRAKVTGSVAQVKNKWRPIQRLWNNNQTHTAIEHAKAYIKWIKSHRQRFRRNSKVKAALSKGYIALARMHQEVGNTKKAFKTFKEAEYLCKSKHSSCFLKYHRELSLSYIMGGKYKSALKTLQTIIKHAKLSEYEKQVFYFWQWVVSRHLGKKSNYDFPYISSYRQFASCIKHNKIIDRIPISNALNPEKKSWYAPLKKEVFKNFFDGKQSQFLAETLAANEDSAALRFYLRLMSYKVIYQIKRKKQKFLSTSQLMSFVKALQDRGLFLEAIGILYDFAIKTKVVDLPDAFYVHYFPTRFQQHIYSAGSELDLPTSLINAFIRRESVFIPTATSPAFALGLMQVLPSTAKWVARRSGIPYRHVSDGNVGLYDAKNNIRIGSQYIHNLLKYFSGNLIHTMASYNAGEGRVKAWTKRFKNLLKDSQLLFIENIPFKETRFYVKWVLFHYLYYSHLYGEREIAKVEFCKYARAALPSKVPSKKVAKK